MGHGRISRNGKTRRIDKRSRAAKLLRATAAARISRRREAIVHARPRGHYPSVFWQSLPPATTRNGAVKSILVGGCFPLPLGNVKSTMERREGFPHADDDTLLCLSSPLREIRTTRSAVAFAAVSSQFSAHVSNCISLRTNSFAPIPRNSQYFPAQRHVPTLTLFLASPAHTSIV